MKEAVIVSACRTPIGSFGGTLKDITARQLGAVCIREALRRLTHLPVVVDPSHATGYSYLVDPVSVAAAAIGADGLIIEVHNDPPRAKCDGAQSQTPEMFAETMKLVRQLRPLACR